MWESQLAMGTLVCTEISGALFIPEASQLPLHTNLTFAIVRANADGQVKCCHLKRGYVRKHFPT